MAWFTDIYKTVVGKKAVMAITGIILFGFVLVHMIGNLHLYEGPRYMNEYGQFLRQVGAPAIPPHGALWIARAVLLGAVVLHIWAAWQVTRASQQARLTRYEHKRKIHTSYASRTMRWGGVIVLLFIIYHLLDFTTGTVHPNFVHGRPYENMVASFSIWWVSLFYIVANIALGMHLYHGVWSMSQTLGWRNAINNGFWRGFATVMAIVIAGGNIAMPLAVLAGIIRP